MYEFETYDPARPRMVTSFKGNQKLIFQGYRYNIHHVVPAKGLKTWRCVCAKKLTSARSWCKGRAETWDNDSQGISKGEHNHAAEHEIAEQEYFKSQLILAAIANPNATLNDLIDEASTYMSKGVLFGSRDSLKKSLMQARKSAENGVFKLKNYKNSDPTRNNNNTTTSNRNGHQQQQQQQQQQQLHQQLTAAQNLLSQQHIQGQQTQQQQQQQNNNSLKVPEKLKDLVDLKMFEQNGTMFSLISIAQQQQQQRQLLQQQNEANNNISGKSGGKHNNSGGSNNNVAAAAAAAAAALLFNNNNNNNGSNNNADAASGCGDSDASADFAASTIASSASTLLSQFVTTTAANYGGAHNGGGASANASPSYASHQSGSAGGGAFGDCSAAAAADFLLSSGFEMMMEGTTPKFPRLDSSRLRAISGGSNSPARCASSNAAFNDSGIGMSPPSAPFHHGPGRRRKNAASANFDVMSSLQAGQHGHGSSDGFPTPVRSNTPLGGLGAAQHSLIQQQQKKKMARINNIFDKLSHKAAAAASSSSTAQNGAQSSAGGQFSLPSFVHAGAANGGGGASSSSQRNSPFSTASSTGGGAFDDALSRGSTIFPQSGIIGFASAAPPKHAHSIETQTEESFLAGLGSANGSVDAKAAAEGAVRLSACIGRSLGGSRAACECRVITVCCCSEETCKRRKLATTAATAAANSTPSTAATSPPPSTPASNDSSAPASPAAVSTSFDAAAAVKPEPEKSVDDDEDMDGVEEENEVDEDEDADGAADDADVDVVGAPLTPPPTAAVLLAADAAVERVTKTLADAISSLEKEKEDSDDAASLELNLGAIKSERSVDD